MHSDQSVRFVWASFDLLRDQQNTQFAGMEPDAYANTAE